MLFSVIVLLDYVTPITRFNTKHDGLFCKTDLINYSHTLTVWTEIFKERFVSIMNGNEMNSFVRTSQQKSHFESNVSFFIEPFSSILIKKITVQYLFKFAMATKKTDYSEFPSGQNFVRATSQALFWMRMCDESLSVS